MHEDPLGAVLSRSDGDVVAAPHAPRFGSDEIVLGELHDHAVHAREPGPAPAGGQLHVGREVRGRKKTVGKNPVGRCGSESRVGCARQRGRGEVGWSVLKPRTTHRGVNIPEMKELSQE